MHVTSHVPNKRYYTHNAFSTIMLLALIGGAPIDPPPHILRAGVIWMRHIIIHTHQISHDLIINMATSPMPSWGPHSGESSIWLHHPCLFAVPIVGRNQYGYITPAFSGSP